MVQDNILQTNGEMAVSNPTSPLQKTPWVRLLTSNEANIMLKQWHYLGEVKGILFSVGHAEGCCVFTNCRSRLYEGKYPGAIELARMVGKPGHKWAMSSLMSQALREVKIRGYKFCVTYADPFAGHNGMVYLAASWRDDGVVDKDGHPLFFIDGKRISPRTLYDRHGTQGIQEMKKIYGERLVLYPKPLKRRFIKIL